MKRACAYNSHQWEHRSQTTGTFFASVLEVCPDCDAVRVIVQWRSIDFPGTGPKALLDLIGEVAVHEANP